MTVNKFRILELTDSFGLLSFRFEFQVREPTIVIESFVFELNVTDDTDCKTFPIDAVYNLENRDSNLYMIVEVHDLGFDDAVKYDERTNFSGLRLTGKITETETFALFIPIFCVGDGEIVHRELMEP
jgi:hypothetical protein